MGASHPPKLVAVNRSPSVNHSSNPEQNSSAMLESIDAIDVVSCTEQRHQVIALLGAEQSIIHQLVLPEGPLLNGLSLKIASNGRAIMVRSVGVKGD